VQTQSKNFYKAKNVEWVKVFSISFFLFPFMQPQDVTRLLKKLEIEKKWIGHPILRNFITEDININ
jgi:hypothetical protein